MAAYSKTVSRWKRFGLCWFRRAVPINYKTWKCVNLTLGALTQRKNILVNADLTKNAEKQWNSQNYKQNTKR